MCTVTTRNSVCLAIAKYCQLHRRSHVVFGRCPVRVSTVELVRVFPLPHQTNSE
jgi:hypothetical protein